MDKRFSISALLSLLLHLVVLLLVSESALLSTGSVEAGRKMQLVGVMQLKETDFRRETGKTSKNKSGETQKSIERKKKTEAELTRFEESGGEPAPEQNNKKQPANNRGNHEQKKILPGQEKRTSVGQNKSTGRAKIPGPSNEYLRSIMGKIEAARRYPRPAREQGREGTARLQLTINSSGEIKRLKLTVPTGYPELDRAARNTIRSAAPFPPLPDKLVRSSLRLLVPIQFQLR